jgi:hypothetical protein
MIVSDPDDPINAGGAVPTIESETLHDYGTNIMYEPIPFDLLRTYETSPQVSVDVGGLPAACKNLTCDYAYIESVGEITAFSISSTTLTITGTDLPESISDIVSITYAQSSCTIDESSISSTSIECEIDGDMVCGDWNPVFTTIYGVIVSSSSDQTVTCTATAISPDTDVNLLGDTILTITGTYLPTDIDDNTISIIFDDDQATECTALTSSSTELTCITAAFDESASLGATLTPTITINSQDISHSLSITMDDSVLQADSISPTSASPVLKTELVITLDSAFPETVNTEDYSVWITDQDDSSNIKYINVVDADDSDKTLTLMFGGAWSGTYDLSIEHSTKGLIDTSDIGDFVVEATIESISPTTVSIYGGNLITITGTNFGSEITDNPVQIYMGTVDPSIDCFVETTSETEITCRLDYDGVSRSNGDTGELIVFLKLSEEATCNDADACTITFSDDLSTVTGISSSADEDGLFLTVTGSSFAGDESTTYFYINGYEQSIYSFSTSEVVVEVTDVNDISDFLGTMYMYFEDGCPEGHDIITTGLTVEPFFASVSAQTGSYAGSVITATIYGIGPTDVDSITVK